MTEAGERQGEQILTVAVAALAAAVTGIDERGQLLSYFANLGDCSQLRDFREVRATLLRSRELLATQDELVTQLKLVASRLAELSSPGPLHFGGRTDVTPALISVPPPHVPAQQHG